MLWDIKTIRNEITALFSMTISDAKKYPRYSGLNISLLFHHDVHVYEVFVLLFEKPHLNQMPPLKGPHETAVKSRSKLGEICY